MGTGRYLRKAPLVRPKKTPSARRHRDNVHRKRLVAMGYAEEKLAKLDSKQLRELLKKKPVKCACCCAS